MNKQKIYVSKQNAKYVIRETIQEQNQQSQPKSTLGFKNVVKDNSYSNIDYQFIKLQKDNSIKYTPHANEMCFQQQYKKQNKKINQQQDYVNQQKNIQINNNYVENALVQNITQIQKVKTYFGILQNHKLQSYEKQIINLIQLVSNQNQQKIFNQLILKVLNNYHQSQIKQIQYQILKNNVFKKCDNFTTNLIIHEIYPSKNYQIVQLDVQLGGYKTLIKILNLQKKQSPLHKNVEISGSGSFGNVYLVYFSSKYYAIKSIYIKSKSQQIITSFQQQQYFFVQAVKQYFLLLLFSQLQIGPKVNKIIGFDLVFSKNCIEFSTEICQTIAYDKFQKKELTQSLRKMHILKIMHRDIKPNNIMYSPTFKRPVFIDFGGCLIINQHLGVKSYTSFFGSTQICSQQMIQRLGKGKGFVDLYYNDIHGLYKTFIWQQRNCNKFNTFNNQFECQQIQNIQNANVLIMKLKYFLYKNSQNQLFHHWRKINDRYFQNQELTIQQIQIKIMQFFKDLNPTNIRCKFYRNEITNEIKNMKQFQELKQFFINAQTQLIFKCKKFVQKQNRFKKIKQFYQNLSIIYSKINDPIEKQINYIRVDRLRATEYLQKCLNLQKQQYKQINSQNLIILSVIILDFCTFNHNKTQQNLQQKIKNCQHFIYLVLWNFPELKNSFNQVFICKIQSLKKVAIFCHFFMAQIWKLIPQNHKQIAMYDVISTLCILGYPTHINQAHQYLISHFIHEQSKTTNILYYWRAYLFVLCFDKLCYSKQKNQFKLVQAPEITEQRIQYQTNLMKNQLYAQSNISIYTQNISQNACDQQNKIINLFKEQNYLIYKTLNQKDLLFQIKLNGKLYNYKNLQWKQQFQISELQFNKWKQTLHLIFLHFKQNRIQQLPKEFKQFIRNSYSIQDKDVYNIQEKNSYLVQDKNGYQIQYIKTQYQKGWKMKLSELMPILIKLYYFFIKYQYIKNLLNIYDSNINNQEISSRHFINYRLAISLRHQQHQKFRYLSEMLILQMKILSAQNAYLLYLCLKGIREIQNLYKSSHIKSIKTLRKVNILFDVGTNLSRQYLLSLQKHENQLKQVKIAIKIYIICLNQTVFLADTMKTYIKCGHQNKQQCQKKFLTQKFGIKLKSQQMMGIFKKEQYYLNIIFQDSYLKIALFQNQVLYVQSIYKETYIKRFQFYFPSFNLDELIQYKIKNLQSCFIEYYMIDKLAQSQFDLKWYIEFKKYYYYLVQSRLYFHIFEGVFLSTLFSSFLQTINQNMKFKEIHDLFTTITDFLKRTEHKNSITHFFYFLCERNKFIFKQFTGFLPNYTQKFDDYQLMNDISNNIITKSPQQNCYMAFIYAYCLNNQSFQKKIVKKLLNFIYKSMHYLTRYAQSLVSIFLYIFFNKKSKFVLKNNPFPKIYNYQLSKPKINTYLQKNKQPTKYNRRNEYFIKKLIQGDFSHFFGLPLYQTITYRIKFKRQSINYWNLPPIIELTYMRKLKKYYKFKRNYRK